MSKGFLLLLPLDWVLQLRPGLQDLFYAAVNLAPVDPIPPTWSEARLKAID